MYNKYIRLCPFLNCECSDEEEIVVEGPDVDDMMCQLRLDRTFVVAMDNAVYTWQNDAWTRIGDDWKEHFDSYTVIMVTTRSCLPSNGPLLYDFIKPLATTMTVCSCIDSTGQLRMSGTHAIWTDIEVRTTLVTNVVVYRHQCLNDRRRHKCPDTVLSIVITALRSIGHPTR